MKQYLELLNQIRKEGVYKGDRTNTGTYSLFGGQLRFDLSQGFPAVTTKRLFFKGVVTELLWFLKGGTNLDYLHAHGVRIWDDWADGDGNLGPIYGYQWRNWNGDGTDQLAEVIEAIKTNPESRRHVISAWNVSQLDEMALLPCHLLVMFYVVCGRLSCHFVMRSTDVGLGLPFNIASYALLTHMVAQVCGLEAGELLYTGNDVHIYANHLSQIDKQLQRRPFPLPELWLNPDIKEINRFALEDVELRNYQAHPRISMPIAV